MAPLDEAAAHQAYDAAVSSYGLADGIELLLMAQMQRVILTDDPGDRKKNPTFPRKFALGY